MDIGTKCIALLLCRMFHHSLRNGSTTAEWRRTWNVAFSRAHPPYAAKIPNELAYVCAYAVDMAYVPPITMDESPKAFRR
jgi:hypothetical protein